MSPDNRVDSPDTPDATFGAFRRKPAASAGVGAAAKAKAAPAQPQGDAASAPAAMPDDLVEIGSIGEAYGIKGWVRVFAHAQPGQGGDALLAARKWWLVKGQGVQAEIRAYRVMQSRLHSGTVVAQLEGIADRDSAEAMRGQRVRVSRKSFPALPEGEFYWVDLQGIEVVNPAGQSLGHVADLIDNGAHTVLRVEFACVNRLGEPARGERMIPFVDAYVHGVDLAARRVTADWNPEWDLEGLSESEPGQGKKAKKAGKKSGKPAGKPAGETVNANAAESADPDNGESAGRDSCGQS